MDLSDSGGSLGGETVYGTHEDSHVVMSEKVQSLAGSIYQEFERMIARYDEDVVKTLMPLLVNVLECLDSAYQINQEHEVELELLREDNEQLVTQYEREKSARKTSEQKLLEFEDAADGERKELSARLEALESIVRMLELKHKNSMEHAGRLEERETELKKEYAKLHERYTELFKTHMDYMERTKMLLSGQQLANERESRLSNRLNIGRSSGPISFGFASLENAEVVDSMPSSPISSAHSSPSDLDNIHAKAEITTVERGQATDTINLENKSVVTSPVSPPQQVNNNSGRLHTKKEQRSGNTLYQELSFHDVDADDDAGDNITGGWVHPGEYASSGMGKEVENLIMENNELLATKNALNVVKDDLIVKVDELTGEIEMLREEILSINLSRTKLRDRISDLEDELRKVKEAYEAKQDVADDEADVPMAQRKRFTRVEMARVLMERNQYKERFMELQEAVRWTEMLRASKNDTAFDKKSKQSIWRFFSKLFSSSDRPQQPLVAGHLRYQPATHQIAPGVRALPRSGHNFLDSDLGSSEKFAVRRAMERQEQYRQVRAHVKKEDGRVHAYGWSLPGKMNHPPKSTYSSTGSTGVAAVPVPVYCRPLAETTHGMKICCAAGVNLMGGYTKDGGLMVGGSVFYSEEPKIEKPPENEIESLDKELNIGREAALLETKLSSLVWVCTYSHSASIVTVIDANNPAEILNSFGVCTNYILCIASVPGASPNDYIETDTKIDINNDDTNDNVDSEETQDGEAKTESLKNDKQQEEMLEASVLGKVTFVENNETAVNKRDQYSASNGAGSTEDGEETDRRSEENEERENNVNLSCDTSIESECKNDEEEEETGGEEKETPISIEHEHSPNNNSKEIMSSVLATMWLGSENGMIYVHSSVANWSQCLHSVKLSDSVVSIVHVDGRVIAGLANGTLAVFRRNSEGEWDLRSYYIVQIGLPHHSVRCLAVVGDNVWCGYRNKIHVFQPKELKILHTLEAHPRRESPVRQMAWLGLGVWVSIRLDSTLRLYHAHTYQHLQDVDIEPYVSKMLGTGKLGFSFVRITSLLISCSRLWIGTSNGVIISVPLSDSGISAASIVSRGASVPGGVVRVCSAGGSSIPYCSMAHAQLSFHGHRDNVKFFVAVPGNGGLSAASTPSEAMSASVNSIGSPFHHPSAMLVMSGGEGYIDFRVGDEMEDSMISNNGIADLEGAQGEPKGEKSHLIVWQVLTN